MLVLSIIRLLNAAQDNTTSINEAKSVCVQCHVEWKMFLTHTVHIQCMTSEMGMYM